MSETPSSPVAVQARGAFRGDLRRHRALSTAKAAWWTAQRAAGRAVVGEEGPAPPSVDAPAPDARRLRQAWREAFHKDAADIAAGLYPVTEAPPADPVRAVGRAIDVILDARRVDGRRKRKGGAVEARAEAQGAGAYPAYYRQNFHFQSGGWFTEESARRYEAQVEALFSGAAGAMRRRALSLLAQAWRDRDQRGLRIVDIACGSGSFLRDLRATFPRAEVMGLDLSPTYVREAQRRSGVSSVQANVERLPFADASLDAISCIYLFHELPQKARVATAREMARVLKPGGHLAFADSIQTEDAPDLKRLLQAFPAFFHEPFYDSYQGLDLPALFGAAGLALQGRDAAFLTKALLFART